MSRLTDDELLGATMGLHWYADLILEALPRMHWRQQKPLRQVAEHMHEKALEIELQVLVRKRWAFLNITRH